ncbi:MAG: ABC transporter permease [Pseudomonadales bacterium]
MRFLPQRIWLEQFTVLVIKEFRQLIRDRAVFLYIIYIFTLDMFIAAGGPSMELRDADLLVHDGDYSVASRELVYRFRSPYFRLSQNVAHPDDGMRLLDRGKATLLIDIPPNFEESLHADKGPATVQVLVDTSKANTGYLASSYSVRIGESFGRDWVAQHLSSGDVSAESLPSINNQRRIWFNPTLNDTWFYAISEVLAMITVACIFLPAVAAVREKERGTLEQLLVSPLTPLQIMLAKVFAMIVVTAVGTAVSVFAIIHPIFSVPVQGSVALFFVLTALYAFTASGLGLLAATFARNSGQVGMILLLIVIPTIMLSGIWTRVESMPDWLQFLILFSPLRYFVEIAYGILLRGAELELLWTPILAMLMLGVALFSVALLRFRRQLA